MCQVAGLDDVLSLLKRVTYTINDIQPVLNVHILVSEFFLMHL